MQKYKNVRKEDIYKSGKNVHIPSNHDYFYDKSLQAKEIKLGLFSSIHIKVN